MDRSSKGSTPHKDSGGCFPIRYTVITIIPGTSLNKKDRLMNRAELERFLDGVGDSVPDHHQLPPRESQAQIERTFMHLPDAAVGHDSCVW